jgi:hypothetical protein
MVAANNNIDLDEKEAKYAIMPINSFPEVTQALGNLR